MVIMAAPASRGAVELSDTRVATGPSPVASLTSARICVAGSGAVGGTLAARLALAGHHVSVIARGAHLAAIRTAGLRLIDSAGPMIAEVDAADHAAFGVQDIIFVSVKAHGLKDMLPQLAPMIGADTVVVPTINGLPWWYFQGEGGRFDGEAVHAVDPDGALLRLLPWRHLVGCVVYIAAHVAEPGVIVSSNVSRIVLGELDHRPSARLTTLCARLESAGITATATERIRDAVWIKLMANLATNPLSVVTGATLDQLHDDEGLCGIVRAIMQETLQVAATSGVRPDVHIDDLLAAGRGLVGFRTSMLQDFDKGQTLELAAIGDAVVELAERHDVAMPVTRHVLALARFRARSRNTHPRH
jgi:2-dehydropantoate 2-reductase